jgi:hypothetical protein
MAMDGKELQQQLDAVARTGYLMGLALPAEPLPDFVGWCQPAAGTVKGRGHLCAECQPAAPGPGWDRLVRSRLAATQPCMRCSRKLETVSRPCTESA